MQKMKVYITFIHLLFFTFFGTGLVAQSDTTRLQEVSIVEKRSGQFAVGSQVFTLDSAQLSLYQGQSLAEVLQFESGIFIKHYSPGNLASTSFRGGNASQTALTWNGFNINSPLNGIFDLSLFPTYAFDEIQVQPGASSALWGSGALGGSIHISQKPDFTPRFGASLGGQAGSFGFHQQNVSIDFATLKNSNRLLFFNQYGKNNFDFFNPYTQQRQKQTNNEVQTRGLLSENYFRLSSKNYVSLNWWYQQTDRNIPPAIFETTRSSQTDDVSRLTAEWLHPLKKGELKTRGAWFSEFQNFTNLTDDTTYYNNSQSFIGEVEFSRKLIADINFDAGFNQTSFWADVQSYNSDAKWQHRQSYFTGLSKTFFSRLKVSSMLRQEVIDQKMAPFTYTIGASLIVFKGLSLKLQQSKVYRVPTLNDTYWAPGGNPNLSSEEGNAQDATIIWKKAAKVWSWQVALSAFNRQIENWIIWQPRQGIWTPLNLQQVHSRGWESNSWIQFKRPKWTLKAHLLTNYTRSTNQKPTIANDQSVGKQLVYTPIYSGSTGLQLRFADFSLSYSHSYTGYTYTASDHSEWLEPYSIASVYLAYHFNQKKIGGSLFFRINNIWNDEYQVVRNRPMPGINYSVGLNLNLKLNHQK
jgi:iron complex outermembrane receptor protein